MKLHEEEPLTQFSEVDQFELQSRYMGRSFISNTLHGTE